ncbi:hypothetical protein BOX15_Mlig026599g1 [Macrostomum lignano]|uniref:Uncharacterized protein n=1 Tax=Macrostomum lignano TaxID=282301 RepID=A0A267F8A5_9PLAT|nr:hypothetical protein BOX15_Mlig026599g1 [Macrostomum lignano]
MSSLKQGTYLNKEEAALLLQIDQHHEKVLGDLTLISQDENDESESVSGVLATSLLERPVTPLQDEIQEAPTQLEVLQELIRRRIQPDSSHQTLSVDQQREMAGILISEVNACWRDIRQQIDYPFFNEVENHELNRRIAVHIVTVCIALFRRYSESADELSKRQVFSSEANHARMKIQLSMDARKFLNVLIIRRYICDDMKETKRQAEAARGLPIEACVYPDMREAAAPADTGDVESAAVAGKNAMTHKSLLDESRPVAKDTRPVYKSDREMLQEMKKSLPSLDTERLESLMARMPQSHGAETAAVTDEGETRPETTATTATESSKRLLMLATEATGFRSLLPRSESALELRGDRRLVDELDMSGGGEDQRSREADESRLRSLVTKEQTCASRTPMADLTPEVIRSDLRELAAPAPRSGNAGAEDNEDKEDEDDELPPLIQASSGGGGGGGIGREENRLQRLMDKIAELDAKARKAAADDEFLAPAPAPPTHPQPGVTALGGLAARMSDARPPERRCLGRVPLAAYSPIWNDLAGDIDADTVKELDSGLFKGQEVREVYEEILKTVDQSHLDFTSDELIEPCVDELSLTGVLASSSLYRRNRERVINERLRKLDKPPWAGTGREPRDWAKPGVFAPGDKKGVVNLSGIHDNFVAKEVTAEADAVRQRAAARQETAPRPGSRAPAPRYAMQMGDFQRNVLEMPKAVQERALRSYQSWLALWREELSPEDYKRYLATQETDYLGLVFHMYDSEDDEDEEAIERQRQEAERRQRDAERQKRLDALLAEKNEFSPGFWNTRAIFMGGLGRDPELPEEAEAAEVAAAAAAAAAAAEAEAEADVAAAQQQQKGGKSTAPPLVFKKRHTSGTAPILLRQATAKSAQKSASKAPALSPQERLEAIWSALQFPDRLRLDMVIKYSKLPDLEAALAQWELTVAAILRRESILAELEAFERAASDPARFRARGHRGSSQARLEESAKREELLARLSGADEAVKAPLEVLETRHGDVATFRGRPYSDKMRWDKIEMLYWLQEERRRPMESLAEASPRSRASPVLPPIT